MTPPRDDFDGPAGPRFLPAAARLRLPAIPRRVMAALGAALLLAIVAVIAVGYPRHRSEPVAAVPVIQADTAPYRVKPTDPGGMAIPYRDSTVFDALHNTEPAPPPPAPEGQGKVENLLGVPEQPLARDKIFPEQKPAAGTPPSEPSTTVTEVKPQTASPPPLPSSSAKPSTAALPSAPPTTEITQVKATPPVMDTQSAPEPATLAVPKFATTAPDRPAAPAANADSYVQLGAVRSAEEAGTTWAKAKADDGAELSGLALHVGKVDLPKGTFYRVQGGPVPAAKARAICAALNARKTGSCLVARR